MIKKAIGTIMGMSFAMICWAQEVASDSVTTTQQEPTQMQQIILYVMTGLGALLLFLSYRKSKWGKRK